jgi:lauroyl/myristoyl acyltransferase
VLPVFLPYIEEGYRIELLPAIPYERDELGTREARQKFTQRIFEVFEPFVRQYPDQWYHFISMWPPQEKSQLPKEAAAIAVKPG